MIFNKTIFLSIASALLSHISLHGMENLKDLMPYNQASSGATEVRNAHKSARLPKYPSSELDAKQKIRLAQMKLKNKETMLNIGTAITVGIIAAPIVIYAADSTLPLINSGASVIAQTSSDIYHFFRDSLPDWN